MKSSHFICGTAPTPTRRACVAAALITNLRVRARFQLPYQGEYPSNPHPGNEKLTGEPLGELKGTGYFSGGLSVIPPASSAASEVLFCLTQTQFFLLCAPSMAMRSASASRWQPTEPETRLRRSRCYRRLLKRTGNRNVIKPRAG